MFSRINKLFPLWAILLAGVAFVFNGVFSGLQPAIVPLLAMVMFMMGLTLSGEDFKRIISAPKPVFVGVILQFLLMPLFAFLLAKVLQLNTQLTAGMILVASVSGGTASNVMTYLAKGDVALSISMTMTSTLLGVIATPLLCSLYLSQTISVDSTGLLVSILQIVLVPVLLGTACNQYLPGAISRIERLLPTLSMLIILLIIAIIVALNAESLADAGPLILLAVILHNSLGMAGGFYISRLMGFNLQQSQTIAIEVGMQNSGLAVALALQFFSATAALPGAIFSIWHNISGSILASIWSKQRSSLEYLLRDEALIKPTEK